MAIVLFLLLRRFFGTVFLSILGMLDHWTKTKLFFLDQPFLIDDVIVVFYILRYFIIIFFSF